MFKINALKFVIFCICVVPLKAYIFSFPYADHLLAIKMKIQQKLEATVITYENLHTNVKQYTSELKNILEVASNHTEIEEFVSNPIYAFKLVKLLTTDFDKLRNVFTGKTALEFSSLIDETVKSYNLVFPSIQDLNGICQAITRLQDIYKTDEENILSGDFESSSDGLLTESDLKELRRCYQYHKHFDVEKWFSSDIYDTDDDDDFEVLLLEYYRALLTFTRLARRTTEKVLETFSSNYFE